MSSFPFPIQNFMPSSGGSGGGFSIADIIRIALGGNNPTATPTTVPRPTTTGSGSGGNNTWNNILQAVGVGSGILGSILNRPKGLSKEQKRAYDMLLSQLQTEAGRPVTVDPATRAQLMTQIAGSLRGANNRITNDFSGRGLGNSGLKVAEQGRASRTAEGAQIAGEVDLLNAAKGEKDRKVAQLQSLLQASPSMQGASAAGVGLSTLSNTLGYLLTLNQLGRSSKSSSNNNNALTQQILASLTGGVTPW